MAMNTYPSGYFEEKTTEKFKKEMEQKLKIFGEDCVMLNPGRILYPRKILSLLNDFYNFKARAHDVFIMGFPRTGSTWLQEVVWTMFHNPNLDHENAEWGIYKKSPFFEADLFTTPKQPLVEVLGKGLEEKDRGNFLGLYKAYKNTRVFKTHLHFDFFQKYTLETATFMYIIRNPLDVCVSLYYFSKDMDHMGYPGDISDFVDDFIEGNTLGGSYLEHLMQWSKHHEKENVVTLFYEDMKADIDREMRKINKSVVAELTAEQIENVKNFTSLAKTKARNEGKEGDNPEEDMIFARECEHINHTEHLTPALVKKIRKHFRDYLGDLLPYETVSKEYNAKIYPAFC